MVLVPSSFFDKACAREYLAQVVDIASDGVVNYAFLPRYDAYFVYAGESEPALLKVLNSLDRLTDYNKILCHWDGKVLSLAIGQGKTLLLSNTYTAGDFVSVMYYVLLAMKSLQLNPEVSTVCFLSELSSQDRIALYHYFRSVRILE